MDSIILDINLSDKIKEIINENKDRPIVFCCIGTDRVVFDSLGPIVGTGIKQFLDKNKIDNIYVYGTVENPVHASNLTSYIEKMNNNHVNPYIIGIDASVTSIIANLDKVIYNYGSIRPGSGAGKDLPSVGSFAIKGVVGLTDILDDRYYHSVRLHNIFKLSDIILNSLINALESVNLEQKQIC